MREARDSHGSLRDVINERQEAMFALSCDSLLGSEESEAALCARDMAMHSVYKPILIRLN